MSATDPTVPNGISGRMSRKQLAVKAGVDPRTLRRLERGEKVSSETQRKVSDALGMARQDDADTSSLDGRYVDALARLSGPESWKEAFVAIAYLLRHVFRGSAVAACAFAIAGLWRIPSDRIEILAAFYGLVGIMLIISLAGILFGWRSRSEAMAMRANDEADVGIVMQGIRLGCIRYIPLAALYTLQRIAGDATTAQAIATSPVQVQVER